MFILMLFALIGAGYWHSRMRPEQNRYEVLMVYVLAGYCGLIMVGVSVYAMIVPEAGAAMVSAELGNPFQDFFMVAYLGMAVMATASIWIRGTYLTANVICWSIYWFGATWLHFVEYYHAGDLDFKTALLILGGHTLVPIFLMIFWWLWQKKPAPES